VNPYELGGQRCRSEGREGVFEQQSSGGEGTARPEPELRRRRGKCNTYSRIGGGRSEARTAEPPVRWRRQWRSGTTTLPARFAAAEQSMRQPVEFSPFAGGGHHCSDATAARTPYTLNTARQEIGDTAGERARRSATAAVVRA